MKTYEEQITHLDGVITKFKTVGLIQQAMKYEDEKAKFVKDHENKNMWGVLERVGLDE